MINGNFKNENITLTCKITRINSIDSSSEAANDVSRFVRSEYGAKYLKQITVTGYVKIIALTGTVTNAAADSIPLLCLTKKRVSE